MTASQPEPGQQEGAWRREDIEVDGKVYEFLVRGNGLDGEMMGLTAAGVRLNSLEATITRLTTENKAYTAVFEQAIQALEANEMTGTAALLRGALARAALSDAKEGEG